MQIQLKSGKIMKFDQEDSDVATRWSWASGNGYAYTSIYTNGRGSTQKKIRFHRLVMERVLGRTLTVTEQVDHINRDTLDNRRSNLRVATHGQNLANRSYRNRSGYRGVIMPLPRYTASIKCEKTKIHIGIYDSPKEAAWMYDQYAIALHGEFATTNFEYV